MCDNKFDPRFYPEVYQAVAGKDYTVYAYMNDGSVRKFDVKPLIKKGGVFRKIEDKEIFKNTLTVLNGTVAWDIAGNRNIYKCIDIYNEKYNINYFVIQFVCYKTKNKHKLN